MLISTVLSFHIWAGTKGNVKSHTPKLALYLKQQFVDTSITGHASCSSLRVGAWLHEGSHIQCICLKKELAQILSKVLQIEQGSFPERNVQEPQCASRHIRQCKRK